MRSSQNQMTDKKTVVFGRDAKLCCITMPVRYINKALELNLR